MLGFTRHRPKPSLLPAQRRSLDRCFAAGDEVPPHEPGAQGLTADDHHTRCAGCFNDQGFIGAAQGEQLAG